MANAGASRLTTASLSADARLNLLALAGLVGGAVLFLFTRRVELLALIGLPMALRMVTSFRTSALVTSAVMLLWLSRIPMVFFDLPVFSYAVYATVALSVAAYLVRFIHGPSRPVFISNVWLWLYVAVVLFAGLNGIKNVDGIPSWMLVPEADYGIPWVYFRSIILPGILLPLLAVITAIAIADRQKLEMATTPAWVLAATMALMVLAYVATSGVALSTMAQSGFRSEHLTGLGFHSNELGTFLAIAYGLLLGARGGMERRAQKVALVLLWLIAAALLLTFSRGALLAFVLVNAFYFVSGSPRKRAVFGGLVLLAWVMAPAAILERAQFGLDSKDLNEISAGRLDNIWLPLLPDVADHLAFGQGLHSIMWTEAQRLQQIYPVNLAHNAYLDLLLDVGVVGTVLILAWYVQLWRMFSRGAATETDVRFRALFVGGRLALVALFLCALSNDRLTPTAPASLLWLAAGVVLGRQAQLQRAGAAVLSAPQRIVGSPRVAAAVRPLVVARSRGEA